MATGSLNLAARTHARVAHSFRSKFACVRQQAPYTEHKRTVSIHTGSHIYAAKRKCTSTKLPERIFCLDLVKNCWSFLESGVPEIRLDLLNLVREDLARLLGRETVVNDDTVTLLPVDRSSDLLAVTKLQRVDATENLGELTAG